MPSALFEKLLMAHCSLDGMRTTDLERPFEVLPQKVRKWLRSGPRPALRGGRPASDLTSPLKLALIAHEPGRTSRACGNFLPNGHRNLDRFLISGQKQAFIAWPARSVRACPVRRWAEPDKFAEARSKGD